MQLATAAAFDRPTPSGSEDLLTTGADATRDPGGEGRGRSAGCAANRPVFAYRAGCAFSTYHRGGGESAIYAGFCAGGSAEPPVAAIHLGRRLPAGSSGLPGSVCGRAVLSLRGLAPGGVCRAARVAPGAGALLPHRFTLTCAGPLRRPVPPSAVCSLWHFPAGRPDWVLPSTVPGGVRTFLGPVRRSARHAAARPTHHHLYCRAQAVGLPPESSARARRRDARIPPSIPRAVAMTRSPNS
jgi:hypothetical protein